MSYPPHAAAVPAKPSGLPGGPGFVPPAPGPVVIDLDLPPAPAQAPPPFGEPDPLVRWNPEPKRPPVISALILALAGAGAAAAAVKLTWVSAVSPVLGTVTATGMADFVGRLAVMTGVLLTLLGLLRFVAGPGRLRGLSALAALAALGLAGLAGWSVYQVHVAEGVARNELSTHGLTAFAEATTFTVGTGLWATLGAGILAFWCAVAGLRR